MGGDHVLTQAAWVALLGRLNPRGTQALTAAPQDALEHMALDVTRLQRKTPPIKKDKNFHYLEGTPPELQLGFQTTSMSSEASQTTHRAPEMIRERKNKIKIKI